MSIKKVEMYTVACDHEECDKTSGDGQATCAWRQPFAAIQEATNEHGWIQHKASHYCPEHWTWNADETEQVPK